MSTKLRVYEMGSLEDLFVRVESKQLTTQKNILNWLSDDGKRNKNSYQNVANILAEPFGIREEAVIRMYLFWQSSSSIDVLPFPSHNARKSFLNCSTDLSNKQSELTQARSDVVVANTSSSSCQTQLTTCNTAKTEAQLNFDRSREGCDARVNNVTDNLNMTCASQTSQLNYDHNVTLTSVQKESSDNGFLANFSLALSGIIILGMTTFFVMNQRRRESTGVDE